jgi:hypothetical protein
MDEHPRSGRYFHIDKSCLDVELPTVARVTRLQAIRTERC